ncbi:MAG: ABC transporter ATP-binding protein [Thermoleophilia bacterium]|nr:ABC transporter ATP-binding protein [Thermoleophilia bacterium]
MSVILETKALTKKFGGLTAVNSLDLQVEQGEILGLIGPNGAGKSTVFGLISGFIPVTSGAVVFDGKDITNRAPFRVARAGIARAFQQSLTFVGMTVLDNVLVGFQKSHKVSLASSVVRSARARKEERELEEKAIATLELLGIAHLRDEKPESLPHGHQKALGVAIALASDPTVLLLDEPATGMNPSESDMMIAHINQVRERGVTVIVVEHDMRVVRSVCDRLICMNFGQKLCEGPPNYVTSHPDVCEAYLGKGASGAA